MAILHSLSRNGGGRMTKEGNEMRTFADLPSILHPRLARPLAGPASCLLPLEWIAPRDRTSAVKGPWINRPSLLLLPSDVPNFFLLDCRTSQPDRTDVHPGILKKTGTKHSKQRDAVWQCKLVALGPDANAMHAHPGESKTPGEPTYLHTSLPGD